ncbi:MULTISPECIES: hypothetical protein [Terrabacteria group]|uniref:hypothetical protein n=1 Tax=Bacillati TaxID=1783272 RepID=UPI00193ABA2C|nr:MULTISPECIES: hypothetical protein [Terrabacteria group]MBW9212278.1 hypothetical protein [Trueperella sp. zg.1013]QRG86182.1 hypothetical protein JOS54_04730 [Bulleidia sp. zg-1006]
MRKVHNGKVYDTETSVFVMSLNIEGLKRDLYQKSTGEFFLYDENSERMRPLRFKEAQHYVFEQGTKEIQNKFFGAIETNHEKILISAYITKAQKAHLKRAAAIHGSSISALIGQWADSLDYFDK